MGADGLPIISYYDVTNGNLKVARCGNALCTTSESVFNTIITMDSTGDVGLYTSITVGADGLPIISYYDQTNGDLKVAHCGNTLCNSGNTIATVDGLSDVGWFTSITLGGNAHPIISYYNVTNGDLKVAHCGNALCNSNNTITTLDGLSDVGQYTSITVGADGLPIISYYNATNGDLKVAHCGNALCNSGSTIATVDAIGVVGQHTSITVGADGLPIISYYDTTKTDLKAAHCSNSLCIRPGWR